MSESSGINAGAMARLQALFDDPSVGRVLVETYGNTETEWVVPSLREMLGPVYSSEPCQLSRPDTRPVSAS